MVVPRKILLPYSLLSVAQHCQDEHIDDNIEFFYTSDYYKLAGSTPLHKLMNKPRLFKMLLENYI